MTEVVITRAGLTDVEEVARLFDDYRVFYEQKSDPGRARSFIRERIENSESVIFLARDGEGRGAGFTQLYPSWSSVSTQRLWILNDLFVGAGARRLGVGRALMERARDHALETGAKGLVLETAIDNVPGQRLYESLGWKRDDAFYRYQLDLEV